MSLGMDALREALEAEREGRYLDSFARCQQALAASPHDADALNLLGRLCLLGGDVAGAVAMQRAVLRLQPEHATAQRDLERALQAVPSATEASACFAAALERAPEIACHHRAPPTLEPFWGMHHVRALLERAAGLDPTHAGALAALANLLTREVHYLDAVNMYRRAVMLEPEFAEAQLGLSDLLHILRDELASDQHRAWALEVRRHYPPCPPRSAQHTGVLMLMRDAPYSVNTPLELAVDGEHISIGRLYLDGNQSDPAVAEGYDVVFNAIGYAEAAEDALQAASRFVRAVSIPTINDPSRVERTSRTRLPQTLRGVPSCIVVPHDRIARESIRTRAVPFVIRPIDTHAGEGFSRIDTQAELHTYLGRIDAAYFHVAPFFDYRSVDGYFRKYRVLFVDGVPYPYHAAISSDWMVHYRTAPMDQHEWMRGEEERFLAAPHEVVAHWKARMDAIAAQLELDYVGIDFTIMPDGSLLIFEADTAMLIHDEDPQGAFSYKRPHLEAMFEAIETMLKTRRDGRDRVTPAARR